MQFPDWLGGGPSKKDELYEELFDFGRLKKTDKKKPRELMDDFYYLSTIFLAFGRKEEYHECLQQLHRLNPADWILEHAKLADTPLLSNKNIRFIFPDLKLALTSILLAEGKLQVAGKAMAYPDQGKEDLTKATTQPWEKYKKHCKPLYEDILEKAIEYHLLQKNEINKTTKETAKTLARYLLDNMIETHRAITQIEMKNRKYITAQIFEITKRKHEIYEAHKVHKKSYINAIDHGVKLKDYTRNMLGMSYYFLVVGLFDMFEKCLDEVEDGSKEHKRQTEYPKDPEWVLAYKNLAIPQTQLVFEWIYPYLEKILRDEGKMYVGPDGLMHPKKIEGHVDLDEAIGPETPLHTSDQYGKYLDPLKKKAQELYQSAGLAPNEAEKYAELLAKYLLDYPMKAYDSTLQLYLAKTGQKGVIEY